MKTVIAIPVWQNQVSTTFDFAERLLIVEMESGLEISRKEVFFELESIVGKVEKLKELGAQVLLCGAVSKPMACAVSRVGIQVIPFITGDIDTVLAAYICDQLDKPCFLQPGCQVGARRRWRNGRQHLGVRFKIGR